MSVPPSETPRSGSVLLRQLAVCGAFAVLLAIIVVALYFQSRGREWSLRREQARHRLDVATQLISRELDRVRADAFFLADQRSTRRFMQEDEQNQRTIEDEFANFVRRKKVYDQIRLLDLSGKEMIRINYANGQATRVKRSELQDKSDRYYVREARSLHVGDVFVSELDLNLEHGQIEKPLKPVVRFVTPVTNQEDATQGYLVLNYLGARMLRDLDNTTLPGFAILLRPDGHYLRSPDPRDDWGWLLSHDRTFVNQFPDEWSRMKELEECQLTAQGAFAVSRVMLGSTINERLAESPTFQGRDFIFVVSYLPRNQVFAESNRLLVKLLLLAGCAFVPLAIFSRYWAQATVSRNIQAGRIAASETRLRELSSRLLRIQEDERRAISREIHDELGQQVTAINLDLKLAQRNLDSQQARPHLERAIRENEGLLQSLHAFARRVRPAILDDLGLRDAVESHLSEFQQRTNIETESTLCFASVSIPNEVADNAYRLLQESLNNVAKHADASKVWVAMSVDGENGDAQLCIAVRDNGRGYESLDKGSRRLGLMGMQERVDLLAGELRMSSDVADGTRIQIRLPLGEPMMGQAESHA